MSLIIAEKLPEGVILHSDGRATVNAEIISENEKKIFKNKYLFGFVGDVMGGIQEKIIEFKAPLNAFNLRTYIIDNVLPLLKINDKYENSHIEFIVTSGNRVFVGKITTGTDNSVCINEEYDKYTMIGGGEVQARTIMFATDLRGMDAIKHVYNIVSRINWTINSNVTSVLITK